MKTLNGLICALVLLIVVPSRALTVDEEVVNIAFYVSPAGNDSQSGTSIAKPFATITKARDAIRTIKSEGELKLPITIYLLNGTYKLSEPFILSPEDSGNEKCPITYSAYTKQQATISGDNTSTFKQLVILQGDINAKKYVQFVAFSGLTFSGIDDTIEDINMPAAIDFNVTKFCTFENNCIRNIRCHALEIYGSGNKITHNEIYDIGGSGIIIRSYGKEPNSITYNDIHDCGKIWFSACGVNIDDGGGNIAHNLVYDIAQTGVYGRHWATQDQEQERRNQEQTLLIEFNEIHDVGSIINDCAGIFIRDSNIVIKNNLIYNVSSYMYYEMMGQYNDKGVPGWGIYLGCETRYTHVINNVVFNTNEGMHLLFGARHNTIENNIFADCLKRQIRYETPEKMKMPNNRFIRNILYNSNPYSEIFNVGGEKDYPAESDYNVFYYSGGKTPLVGDSARVRPNSYAEWLGLGFDKNSVVADPLFTDPTKHDYSLLPGSPAITLGFKPIDISKVGLRGQENVGPIDQ